MHLSSNQLTIHFRPLAPKEAKKTKAPAVNSSKDSKELARLKKMQGKEFIYKCKNIRLLSYRLQHNLITISYSTISYCPLGKEPGGDDSRTCLLEVALENLSRTLKEFLRVNSKF